MGVPSHIKRTRSPPRIRHLPLSQPTEENRAHDQESNGKATSAVRMPRRRNASPWSSRALLLGASLAVVVLAPLWINALTFNDPRGVIPFRTTADFPPPPPAVSSAATNAPGQVVARDSFARVLASGWGAAELGGDYSITGTSQRLAVADGVARAFADGSAGSAHLPDVVGYNLESSIAFRLPSLPAPSRASVALLLRQRPDGSSYRATVELAPAGQVTLSIDVSSAGVMRRIAGPIALDIDSVQGEPAGLAPPVMRMRALVTGSDPATVSARVWLSAAPEPSEWNVRTINWAGSLQAAGAVGMGWSLTVPAGDNLTSIEFDDLLAVAGEEDEWPQ